jgi:hypothetical protein
VSVESKVGNDAAEQRDAADEARLDAYGNVFAGKAIKYQGEACALRS